WIPEEGGPLTSGVDHQTIGGGPYHAPLAGGTAVYPNAVYYCSQDLVTAFCARSDDGGATYGPTIPMYVMTCGGIHGHVKVAPDGTVYVPHRSCGVNQGVAVSEDNGLTWTARTVADNDPSTSTYDSLPGHWDPSVGVGSNGTVYFGYDHQDGTPHVAVSHDRGKTWIDDQNVGVPFNVKDTAFSAVVAGDDNRAAFAFLGANRPSGSPGAVWHLYIARTFDGGHSWITTDATPTDPVQLGGICFEGFGVDACPNGDRNLLDFMDVTVDKEGRVLVGYADGCVGCTNASGSRSKLATIARQTCGRRLFSQYDPATDDCGAAQPTPTPTPFPTPIPDSCKGSNVVVDATGDAVNPGPGGQGPTDQADIISVSFEEGGDHIVTKMKVKNLTTTPSPGTTFTSYFVVWTAPNGTLYASEADVDATGLVNYGYGPFDGTNQLSTFNATTGTITTGANGVISVNVPLSGVGNPTVPISDPSAQAAVNQPYAVTVAGQGAMGAGLIYNDPMDRTATGGRWSVCPALPTPTPTATPTSTPTATPTPGAEPPTCYAPGTTVITDPAGDQTGAPVANQHLDIVSVSVAEPAALNSSNQRVDKLLFTLKVANLSTVQPNSIYRVVYVLAGTTYHVSMVTDANAKPTYSYGRITTGVGTDGQADAGAIDTANGTIKILITNSKVGNPQAGATLTGMYGDARLNAAGTVFAPVDTTTTTQSYTLVGSASCTPPNPTATPTPAPPVDAASVPRYFNYAAPAGVAEAAGEPSIGVNWRSERIFSNSGGAIPNGGTVTYFGGFLPYMLKATFDDSASPANVLWDQAPLTVANAPRVYGDPILFTDSRTGRTFVSQELGLTPLGSTMEFTDDDGRSFRPSEGSGAPSGIDHQTVGGGAYHQPLNIVTNPVYPNAVYYCSQALYTATCSLSVDGGQTFGPGVPIYTFQDCGGIHGHVKVAPDGTVYVPNRGCNGEQGIALSEDNGLTWKVRHVTGSTEGDTDPSVGIASDGTVFFGYETADGHARVAVSHNKGETWINDTDVGAPLGIQNMVFPAVVAGDGGVGTARGAFAFYGTTTGGNYNADNFAGVWYLFVASTFDGGRTWTTVNATPNDPMQRGRICTDGVNCTSSNGLNTRNLLDFFDATVDKEGRVLVGYNDGCVGACVQGGQNSATAKAVIARQSGGKRMFAAFDPPTAPAPGAPGVSGSASGTTASLTWSVPDNGGAAISGYKVYRRDGATVTPLATVTGTSFTDTGYNAAAQSVYRVTAVNANGESAYKEFNPTGGGSQSPCAQPGALVVSDVNNDGQDLDGNQNTPPDARVNIKSLYVAEPYMGAGVNKLVFTLKVGASTL
ncbi:MAG TPA: hypothetical protein VJT82_02705, partial [Pyrinomonadaceae bacterium]|nr:hypothetical protein [Pyrinomonadaceae bacterium]